MKTGKIKLFQSEKLLNLEKEVNQFIKDKEIISIQLSSDNAKDTIIIVYK